MRKRKAFTTPFDPSDLEEYDFDSVPIDEEVSLMDEQWLADFLPALRSNDPSLYSIGYHTPAIVHHRGPEALEISIYLTMSRFHEIRVALPRDQFIVSLGRAGYDIKQHIFVKQGWLSDFHLRHHCVFALFDAIGVKAEMAKGALTNEKLLKLRSALDDFADQHNSIALVSFSDSLLFKTSYQLGQYDSDVRYSYKPELAITVFPAIRAIYREILGLNVYACFTQGLNQYDGDSLLHMSRNSHHVSLNSLGLPFAQLLAMDAAARTAIRNGVHPCSDLYMDRSFYHSLRFKYAFDKNARPKYEYENPMGQTAGYYFAENIETISGALEDDKPMRTDGT